MIVKQLLYGSGSNLIVFHRKDFPIKNVRILSSIVAGAMIFGLLSAPLVASAATGTATVTVAVLASTQATIGVSYSGGSNINCAMGTSVAGYVPCSTTATLTGGFRSTKADTGGASVSLTGVAIPGSGGASIPPSAFQMTCTGSATGATYPGTPGTLASSTPLSTSAVNCQSWTGTLVATYSLVVALSLDSSQVPADTYTATGFTATATAN